MFETPYFSGRERVEINISKKDFLQSPTTVIEKIIGKANAIHSRNVRSFELIHKELMGEQSIKNKSRTDNSEINNKVVENHLYKIWRFKTSYIVGNPIQYSNKSGESDDDIKYFNRYIQDCKKNKNDIDVYNDVFEFGIGYRMIIPTRKEFDEESESPVEDFYLSPYKTFVAYSSCIPNEVLFSAVISYKLDINTNKNNKITTIYYTDDNNDCYAFELDDKGKYLEGSMTKELYKGNPIIEYVENKYRTGVVEVIIGLQNAINAVSSMQLDDIEQFIQAYMIFLNIDVDLDTEEGKKAWVERVSLYKKTRALVLTSNDSQFPADFKQITNSLDHTSINALHDRFKTAMYDIVSAPQSSGSVTSGGDTTGARLLGNGWESALSDSKLSTNYLKSSEYEWIKSFIRICKESTTTLDKIYPSEIEIKYDINLSDNILVKTQAITNLYNSNVPKELILTAIPILSDVYGSAKKWQEFDDALKEKENETKVQNDDMKNIDQKVVNNNQINDLQNKA